MNSKPDNPERSKAAHHQQRRSIAEGMARTGMMIMFNYEDECVRRFFVIYTMDRSCSLVKLKTSRKKETRMLTMMKLNPVLDR